MKKFILNIITALLLVTIASHATAGGFHYQIDVTTRLLGNQQGRLAALQMSWLYSEEMTKILLEDQDVTPARRQQTLASLANAIMADLKKLHYFTRLQLNGKPVNFANASNYGAELVNSKHLRLFFTLPLAQPVDVHKASLNISMADPNGSALLSYSNVKRVSVQGIPAQCRISLVNFKQYEHGQASQRIDIGCK